MREPGVPPLTVLERKREALRAEREGRKLPEAMRGVLARVQIVAAPEADGERREAPFNG